MHGFYPGCTHTFSFINFQPANFEKSTKSHFRKRPIPLLGHLFYKAVDNSLLFFLEDDWYKRHTHIFAALNAMQAA